MRLALIVVVAGLAVHGSGHHVPAQDSAAARCFGIHVVDSETGRGVPLVELETVHGVRYVTDSAGWIAVDEPDWMGQPVFFHVKSDGYEHAKDGFGFAGMTLTPQPGQEAVVRLQRTNIAQRLYRVTGEGIYRDSLLLGKPVPLRDPQRTGKVVGQDSAMAVIYRDRLCWFWGDTNRLRYPLGHYWMAGATSDLPGPTLDPNHAIDLEYFVGDDGFSRPMARLGVEGGPIWIDAVCVLPDDAGQERLVCHYAHMKNLGEMLDHGLAVYSDQSEQFEKLTALDMDQLWRFPGQAHPICHRDDRTEYLYLGEVFPTVRVPRTLKDFTAADNWEAWTCLEPGSDPVDPQFVRDADGRLVFSWQRQGRPVDIAMQKRWIAAGTIRPEDAPYVPLDVETKTPVYLHRGSVTWNAYRQKWIMIACQQGGTSLLGEIWYAESPAITGPWPWAKKIVTHKQYSFYNPVQHPFFDQDGGRVIFFEGTYTTTFSGNPSPTPRYDYNQIMYRLDLDHPQLKSLTTNSANQTDYTLMWWADGFPRRSPDQTLQRVIQTNRYAMVFDVERMAISHMGRLADPLSYADAARSDTKAWAALPAAQLDLELEVDGVRYRCSGGGAPTDHDGPRIIESGRFVQRADITDLVFTSPDGRVLPVQARLETLAWPDRLTLLLEAAPRLLPIPAGDTFGRVAGGFGLDGTNHLDCAVTADELPAAFTLACWVYVPADFFATQYDSWIACYQGNEWVDGHVGICMGRNGVPRGMLDIGGGRENGLATTAVYADGRPRVLEIERWHHLALTYDGAKLSLYIDGQLAGSQVAGKPRQPHAGTLTFGRRGDNAGDGYHFRGVIDEVRLYGRALAAAEMAQLGTQPAAVLDVTPMREWPFAASGAAQAQRETAPWQNAAMTLRLRTADKTLEQLVTMPAPAAWTRDNPGHVAVSVDFGPPVSEPPAAVGDSTESRVQVVASDPSTGKSLPVTVDEERGWTRVDLDGIVRQGDDNGRLERVHVQIENRSDREQPVRLLWNKTQDLPITGMSALLRDRDGYPTGIPVQLSKNWHRQEQRRLLYEGPWFHGFTYLRLPARSQQELELVLAGAHWGGVAAAAHAQLCLVGWGSNQQWDQSAIGSWGESFCFEPDRVQASALVCDVRPLMVHAMNNDTPTKWSWTNNVGGGDVLRLFTPEGTHLRPTGMKTAYLRHGPCLTEVVYAGTLCDGAASHWLVTSLYRTDDMARCIYRLRLDVNRPIDYSRFVILQIGADTYGYTRERQMAVGNESGLVREWTTTWGGDCYRTAPVPLEGRIPWVSLHDAASRDPSKSGAWANRGLIVRSWRARLGGRDCGPWLAEHGVGAGDAATSTADILPPPETRRLEPGDYVEATIEHVVVPQFTRDYYGPNESLRHALERDQNTWHMIHREAVGNDLQVVATSGQVEQMRPVALRAVANRAEFTVTGGKGYIPLTIRGLTTFRAPRLEIRTGDGDWRTLDQATFGNDFWQTDFDPASQTWEVTFTVEGDSPDDGRQRRQFRFISDAGS